MGLLIPPLQIMQVAPNGNTALRQSTRIECVIDLSIIKPVGWTAEQQTI